MNSYKRKGFTLIEVAVALGILGALTLVVGTLFIRTVDTYGQVMSETDTTKQARHCLGMISREMRESVNFDIWTPAAGPLLGAVQDALLLTSARQSDGTFALDANNFPSAQSIIIFYLNTTPEGITQLVRHQVYYVEDLSAFQPPFQFPGVDPYQGSNIVLLDNLNNVIPINRSTGAVAGNAPFRPPRILMNRTTSLDIVDDLINPLEIRITCQSVDRYARTATTRLSTRVAPRNL